MMTPSTPRPRGSRTAQSSLRRFAPGGKHHLSHRDQALFAKSHRVGLGHHHQINRRQRRCRPAKQLSDEPLDPIANHCASDFASDREPQAWATGQRCAGDDRECGGPDAHPFSLNPLKLPAMQDASLSRKTTAGAQDRPDDEARRYVNGRARPSVLTPRPVRARSRHLYFL